jgi:hypothetical protein
MTFGSPPSDQPLVSHDDWPGGAFRVSSRIWPLFRDGYGSCRRVVLGSEQDALAEQGQSGAFFPDPSDKPPSPQVCNSSAPLEARLLAEMERRRRRHGRRN